MKKAYKFLSVVLAIALMLSVMPLSLFQVNADEFTWNNNATMTLTTNGAEVIPTNIIETDDTKLKIYTIDSDKPYTLTTSDDNDYGVVFDIVWTKTTDESGIDRYDEDIDLTLDNVTIKTKNPRHSLSENNYAAMNFCSTTSFYTSNSINIIAVGTNNIELLGVKNDTADDNWSAISSTNDMLVFRGDGTLNAGCTYDNAVGSVAAIRNEYTVYTKDTITLNATANVTNASSEPVGCGIVLTSYGLVVNIDTKVNVIANKYGVYNTATSSPNLFMFGDMNIKAGERGISWESSSISVGDDVTLTIEGLTDATSPKVGVITKRGFSVGSNCTVNIKALNEALSCKATTVEDHSAPVYIGENSVVNLSGSFESPVFALDCGLDGGSNNYWVSYPASDLDLADNAKLTVNAGYLAIQAYTLDMMSGSSLDVTTTKQVDSSNAYDYAPVRLYTNSYIESGATININSAAKSAIYSGKLHLKSNNIFIKALEEVFAYTSFTRYENVYTFECDDGINWVPFDSSSKGKAYFTTRNVENHICYGPKWTQVDDTYTHSTTCIYCGETITEDCVWDRGVWSYVSSGVYELKFTCNICKAVRISDVEYHTHTYETYTPFVDKYGQFKHEGFCTYDGCEASTEEYCSNSLSNEYHKTPTLLVRDCTKCGQCATTTEIEAGTSTHFDAKSSSCNTPGNIEYYNCDHCNQYYADEAFTKKLSPTDVFITPSAHHYVDGVCTICGNTKKTFRFVELDERPYNHHQYNCIIVGKASDGTLYVLGNETVDGKRKAVKISNSKIDESGVITISSADAEFLMWDNMNDAFVVDNGYLSILDGEIYVYNPDCKNDTNISRPAEYVPESYGDESGSGYMEAYITGKYSEREYMVFNEETLTFEASDTQAVSLYLYVQICEHDDMYHNEHVAATCTEQGIREYWYCGRCQTYFGNAQGTIGLDIPEDVYDVNEYLVLPATGHTFNDKDVCNNCTMKRPVYKQVSTLEDFDKLSQNASFIIVIKDGDKTYAARLPDTSLPCEKDSDSDGIVDAIEIDKNSNTIPDVYEDMYNNWGMGDWNGDETIDENDYKEWIGDLNEDGEINFDDYVLFFEYNHWDIEYIYEELARRTDNFVEVTMSDNGSIKVTDEGAMEFQMMVSGVWGGQPPIEDSYDADWEYFGIKDTERMRAAWVPNIWIANSGMMGNYSEDHFMTQYRYYGDYEFPGIIDNKNWKISFNDDGTACLVSTWSDFDNTAALQFVKYTNSDGNDDMTIVGMYGDQWEYSDIMINRTATLPVYLFASEAEFDHTHTWGDWISDSTTDTHTCRCTFDGCLASQTESHNWDNGVITSNPTCTETGVVTYSCNVCSATKTSLTDSLGHNWSDWTYDTSDSHFRQCNNNCGKKEYESHNWSQCTAIDQNSHSMTCNICDGSRTQDHIWDNGTITKQPTEWQEGEITYACEYCSYTRTESIDKLVHICTWSAWEPNDNNHMRHCLDENCNNFETLPHEWDDGIITTEATCTQYGIKTYTCATCKHTRIEELPTIDHVWSDWRSEGNDTHTRTCHCGATESEDCSYDDGTTTNPSCTQSGGTVYTCSICKATHTDYIPSLGHDWTDWSDTGDSATADIHKRSCKRDGCGEKEVGNHEWSNWISTGNSEHQKTCLICLGERINTHVWDEGIIVKEATTNSTGAKKHSCYDCNATKTDIIPKIVCDHSWGKWIADNDETHTHTCVNGNGCEAYQRQVHEWDNGVITNAPTETTEGIKTYTCITCSHTKTESIDILEHVHNFTEWISVDEHTHTRYCKNGNTCTAFENEKHICDVWAADNNQTHSGVCSVCAITLTQPHNWSDWTNGTFEGQYVRSCLCGAFEEMTVPKPIDQVIINNTNTEENSANAELVDDAVDIFNNVLTNEEQNAVANGATVSVYLEVQDIPVNNVSSSDKIATQDALQDDTDEADIEIGMYLDINLFKEVTSLDSNNSTTNSETSKITQTHNKVTITISIPEDLINTDNTINRTYKIVRVHEDEFGSVVTDIIEGVFDPESKTFTFETDKFSTYALAVVDQIDDTYYGDVNGDDKINGRDYALLLQYINGWPSAIIVEANSDANGDGKINGRDYAIILQYINGWPVTLGPSA